MTFLYTQKIVFSLDFPLLTFISKGNDSVRVKILGNQTPTGDFVGCLGLGA